MRHADILSAAILLSLCTISFMVGWSYNNTNHMLHNNENRHMKCAPCNATTPPKIDIRHDNENKPLECPPCNITIPLKMDMRHTNENKHMECPPCSTPSIKCDNHASSLTPVCSKGHFVGNDEVFDVGNGLILCADHILYGYDVLFEQKRLFTLSTFLGVPAQQDPQDAMVLAELITLEKPDVIIELGTNEGGGALFYASIMELVKNGRIITVDPRHFNDGGWTKSVKCENIQCRKADEVNIWKDRVTFIQGMPLQVINQVRKVILSGTHSKVWLIEDSSHAYETVLENIKAYSHFVTPNGLLQVQDTKLTRFACGLSGCGNQRIGPLHAVMDFLATGDNNIQFTMDRSLEYFGYTHHAKGWLRRNMIPGAGGPS